MSEISVHQQINASPVVVFATLTDFEGLTAIVSGIKSAKVLTDGPVGIGTKYTETRVMMGREASEEMEITEFDPPNGFLLEADNHGAHYRTRHTLEPSGDGTRVTVIFGATANRFFAKIMLVVLGPLMKKTLIRCLQEDLDEIKKHLEK